MDHVKPMALSAGAKAVIDEISDGIPKLGDLKKLAARIKIDHDLALELWSTGGFYPRLLATLIFDKKQLSQSVLDGLALDLEAHNDPDRDQITDWLMANQLSKDKRLTLLIQTWEMHTHPVMRRIFWYHQARLRWTGQTPPGNTSDLLDKLEKRMAGEEPSVQWAMNFCACQIGVHEPEFRSRCIALGEKLGLYKGDHVSKNCTPSYLPEFIRIETAKRVAGK